MRTRTTRVARRRTARATLTTLLLLAIAGPVAAQEGFPGEKTRDRWRNDVVLYLWAVNIDADLTLGSTRAPVDVTFGVWTSDSSMSVSGLSARRGLRS